MGWKQLYLGLAVVGTAVLLGYDHKKTRHRSKRCRVKLFSVID